MTPVISPHYGEICFPPMIDSWNPAAPVGDNSLGIQFCSHHTIFTDNVARGLRWSVDILGGRVVHQGSNDFLETQSTYVWLGKTIIELPNPSTESRSWNDWQNKTTSLVGAPQEDVYQSITFKMRDLNAA